MGAYDSSYASPPIPDPPSFVRVPDNTGEQNLGGYKYAYSAGDHNATNFVDITLIGRGGKLLR